MSDIDFSALQVMTFDCYGTLIDWETGILNALRPLLSAHDVTARDDQLLETYARSEARVEAGPYLPYRQVLGEALKTAARDLGFQVTDAEAGAFGSSVGDWPAFADSAAALAQLQTRFKLGVITNCDDDLFALSSRRLGIAFNWVITAQRARSYKPDLRNFELALETIGVPKERLLHVAQSLFHDHVPAKRLALSTVWVNRRQGRAGFGATPPAEATPDLTVRDLASLAVLAQT